MWAWILGIVSLVGIVSFGVKVGIEWGDQAEWGYTAAMVAFLFSAFGGAPLVAIAPMIAKANWVRPVARFAQLCSLVSIVVSIWMIPLILNLPMLVVDGARRRSIWFEGPDVSPHVWAIVSLTTLIVASIGMIWAYGMPDFAAMRDHSTGWKQRFGNWAARGWIGSSVQWRTMRMRIGMMGTLYFFTFVFIHFMLSTDFAMSLVPGWRMKLGCCFRPPDSWRLGADTTLPESSDARCSRTTPAAGFVAKQCLNPTPDAAERKKYLAKCAIPVSVRGTRDTRPIGRSRRVPQRQKLTSATGTQIEAWRATARKVGRRSV